MKIGDKVRVIENTEHENEPPVGHIGFITNLGSEGYYFIDDFICDMRESEIEPVDELPAKPKIELTVKHTVFINGVEMRKWELVDLRNKIDNVLAKMD